MISEATRASVSVFFTDIAPAHDGGGVVGLEAARGLARRRSAPVLPGDRGSWGVPLIRIQEQTKDAARLGFPQHLQELPDLVVMTHSNRAAVFHLSLLIAER